MTYLLCYLGVWLSLSGLWYKYLTKITLGLNWKEIKSITFLCFSIGFISIFTLLGLINIVSHLIGHEIRESYYLLIFSIYIFTSQIKNTKVIIIEALKSTGNILITKNNIIKDFNILDYSLLLIIVVQIIALLLRLSLPVTHDDQLNQYFYDSLQISRLENLSLISFYKIGQAFRTDSLGSFFDAFTLQLTNSWSIARSTRLLALILTIGTSLEILRNMSILNIRKLLLITAIITTLPDIWDIGLSGKQDIYICLFELTGFGLISLSVKSKEIPGKIILLCISLSIGLISIFSRLSSIAFFGSNLIIIAYYLYKYFRARNRLRIRIGWSGRFLISFIILISVILVLTSIGILNYIYLDNPFYRLSPPGSLENAFPYAIYKSNYESFKDLYNMNIQVPFIKNFTSVIYAALGLEPIRYISNLLIDLFPLNLLALLLNNIGPKSLMVSYLSLSPILLLPLIQFRRVWKSDNHLNINFLIIWLSLWSLGITYTRIIISCCICLCIVALSDDAFSEERAALEIRKGYIYKVIYVYGLITIFCFTIWSITNLADLPIRKLGDPVNYERGILSREYLILKNSMGRGDYAVPTNNFEEEWRSITNSRTNKIKLLVEAPPQFAYFMNKGIIINKLNPSLLKGLNNERFECFEVNEKQIINKISCKILN